MLDLDGAKFEGARFALHGYVGTMDADSTAGDLLRVIAGTEVVLSAAEKLDADIVDEAILAELHDLHDRACRVLRRLEHSVDVG
jgi:hypothetical protein